MIVLKEFKPRIAELLDEALARFAKEHPDEEPTAIGLYSSPRRGWISLCINTDDTATKHEDNCPDFRFVEFQLLEVPEWAEERNADEPVIEALDGQRTTPDPDDGDEGYSEPFFQFLVEYGKEYFEHNPTKATWIGVQMLDSDYTEFWKA